MASTDSVAPPRAATGIVLMVVAMLMIPIVDGQAKYLSAGYSPLFISWGAIRRRMLDRPAVRGCALWHAKNVSG